MKLNKNQRLFIQHGKTALFYATKNSKHTNDVKEVLRYLVVEKDIDISAVEKVQHFYDTVYYCVY